MAKKEANNKNENKVKKHFFKDMKAELKKVIWPTKKQLVNNTVAVVTIVLIVVAIVFVLDTVFDIMNQYGITRLQEYVVERFEEEEEENSNDDSTGTSNESEGTTEGETTETEETTENENQSEESNTESNEQ